MGETLMHSVAVCVAENNRPVYIVHPWLLHAHLGEKKYVLDLKLYGISYSKQKQCKFDRHVGSLSLVRLQARAEVYETRYSILTSIGCHETHTFSSA